MAQRNSRRINVFICADLAIMRRSYHGFLGNISERGMYMRISSTQESMKFAHGARVTVTLIVQKEKTDFLCRVVWTNEVCERNQLLNSTCSLGLEIIDSQDRYMEFYHYLAANGIKEYLELYGFELTLK